MKMEFCHFQTTPRFQTERNCGETPKLKMRSILSKTRTEERIKDFKVEVRVVSVVSG
jgi:hypothetical protein